MPLTKKGRGWGIPPSPPTRRLEVLMLTFRGKGGRIEGKKSKEVFKEAMKWLWELTLVVIAVVLGALAPLFIRSQRKIRMKVLIRGVLQDNLESSPFGGAVVKSDLLHFVRMRIGGNVKSLKKKRLLSEKEFDSLLYEMEVEGTIQRIPPYAYKYKTKK
jgi:hypothetical protein